MLTKRCSKCRKDLPADPQNFYRQSDASDGFNSRCKACVSSSHKRKPEQSRELARKMRSKARLFLPLLGVANKLIADLEAARKPDAAYQMAKRVLEKVKEQKL